MKKLMYFGMGLALCMGAAVFTGCEDKPLEDPATGGGSGGGSTEDVRGGIEGVVTDKAAGALVSQALVELLPTDKKTRTDDLGAFSFADLKSGTYQLRVSKTGYETYTSDDIAVQSGRTVRRAISLAQELTDLRILDTADNMLSVLDLGGTRRGVFKLKNTGSAIVEWEIPTLSEGWIRFNKQSGKLAPGATETIQLTIQGKDLSMEENEAMVYIGSTVGTLHFKVSVMLHGECYEETAFGMSLHMVEVVGRPIYIGAFEITQSQWYAVMGTTIERQRDKAAKYNGKNLGLFGVGDTYPMYYVSWNEAQAFCEALSVQTGKTYRLPTSAEWRYAARGGHNVDSTEYAGSNIIGEVAWYDGNSYDLGEDHPDFGSHPVGQKKPNGLGIYDMSGNVWEFCQEWVDASCVDRILRGGGWFIDAQNCRVSSWAAMSPGGYDCSCGFRVVCER